MAEKKAPYGNADHEYIYRYADDDTYCDVDGCSRPKSLHKGSDPMKGGPVSEILEFAQYIVNEQNTSLMLGQLLNPGDTPENVWYLNHENFELAKIRVTPDGHIIDYEFTWLSNATSIHGFDVVPFLIATIHWLAEGRK